MQRWSNEPPTRVQCKAHEDPMKSNEHPNPMFLLVSFLYHSAYTLFSCSSRLCLASHASWKAILNSLSVLGYPQLLKCVGLSGPTSDTTILYKIAGCKSQFLKNDVEILQRRLPKRHHPNLSLKKQQISHIITFMFSKILNLGGRQVAPFSLLCTQTPERN